MPGTMNMVLPDNSTIDLREPNWTPFLLLFLAVAHFLLAAVLILSYWYLKVCVCTI